MNDPVLTFLQADTVGRVELLEDATTARAVREYLGHAAFSELERISRSAPTQDHLGIKSPPNLIFVPGVMGSLLQSETKFGVWWLDVRTRHHLDDLALSPDGLTDFDQNNQISAFNVDTGYEQFGQAVLARDDFGHRLFAYDWRKMYSQNSRALRDLILSLHEKNGRKPVHLVAHSMGGLMVRSTLKEFGDELWPALGRIAFIGTPHYGSAAIAGYLKNHLWGLEQLAVLGFFLSRKTFRSLWGVLSLLPAPAGTYPGTRPADNPRWVPQKSGDAFYPHPCANFNFYDAEDWKLDLTPGESRSLQTVLDGVAAFHRELEAWHSNAGELLQEQCDRMLMVAGVGYKSLFRLEYTQGWLWESMNKITSVVPGDANRDGDGRVPLASATLRRVTMRYVKGVHGGLTNIPAVYNDVFRWLKGQPMTQLADTPQAAQGAHLAAAPPVSATPHLDGSSQAVDDDPGYYRLDEPTLEGKPMDKDAADRALAAGRFPEFNLVRIL